MTCKNCVHAVALITGDGFACEYINRKIKPNGPICSAFIEDTNFNGLQQSAKTNIVTHDSATLDEVINMIKTKKNIFFISYSAEFDAIDSVRPKKLSVEGIQKRLEDENWTLIEIVIDGEG